MVHGRVGNASSTAFARVAGAWLAAMACVASAQEGVAVPAAQSFEIPAGPLGDTLLAVGRASGAVIAFDPALTQGRNSAGLHGVLSREEAVRRVLEGSGLVVVLRGDGAMEIKRGEAAATPDAPVATGMQLPEVRSTVAPSERVPTEGFVAPSVSSVTRTDTLLSEIPESVQVITNEQLRTQQARSVNDVLGQVSGVLLAPNGGAIYIRGFDAPLRVDGQQLSSVLGTGSALAMLPIGAIDSVAVLKGADAISAGVPAPPGGMIDVLLKRPESEPVRQWVLEGGSSGRKVASLDLAGSFAGNDAWRYRFVASGRADSRSRDGTQGPQSSYLAPSLGYERGATSLVFGAEVQTERLYDTVAPFRTLGPSGLQGPVYGLLPVAAMDGGDQRKRRRLYYDLTQKFSGGWTFHSVLDARTLQRDVRNHGCLASADQPFLLSCYASAYSADERVLNSTNTLKKEVQVGSATHTLLAGLTTTSRKIRTNFGDDSEPVIVPYAGDQLPASPPLSAGVVLGRISESYRALYLQDQIKWGRWSVLANVGKASLLSAQFDDTSVGNLAPRQSRTVYSVGAAFRATDHVTVYANLKKSFEIGKTLNTPGIVDGTRRQPGYTGPPVDGRSNEAGLKLNLLDDRLLLTTSVYRATQTHVMQLIGFDSEFARYETLPTTSSKGFELDVSGRLSPAWSVAGSLTYSRFSYAAPSQEAAGISQIPRLSGNLWTRYEVQDARWRGWGFGLGVSHRGGYASTQGYRIPGQARVDASVFYKSTRWTTTLGARNLFNRTIYSNFAGDAVALERGRTLTLTTVYNF